SREVAQRCDTSPDGSITFADIAPQTGTEDMTTSMGVTWADPNRDGHPDIYVSNSFCSRDLATV
ncbi:MAG: VCBS repeat-containing protein, partial [Pseudomonadota bacterium]